MHNITMYHRLQKEGALRSQICQDILQLVSDRRLFMIVGLCHLALIASQSTDQNIIISINALYLIYRTFQKIYLPSMLQGIPSIFLFRKHKIYPVNYLFRITRNDINHQHYPNQQHTTTSLGDYIKHVEKQLMSKKNKLENPKEREQNRADWFSKLQESQIHSEDQNKYE